MEKLFTVTPDASPDAIKLGLSGARSLNVNNEGQLVAETELGPVKFTKPIVYQEIDGKRVYVDVAYKMEGVYGGDGNVSNGKQEAEGQGCKGAAEQGGRGELETPNSKLQT